MLTSISIYLTYDCIKHCLCTLETFREQARENGVLSALLPFLSSTDSHTQLQVLRAIGNLCIDNGIVLYTLLFGLISHVFYPDNNRETVLAAGGCQTLIQLIKKCSNDECINERYKSVVCGCVLNLVVDNGEEHVKGTNDIHTLL